MAGGRVPLSAKGNTCGRPMAGATSIGDNQVSNRRRINENNEEVLGKDHNLKSFPLQGC